MTAAGGWADVSLQKPLQIVSCVAMSLSLARADIWSNSRYSTELMLLLTPIIDRSGPGFPLEKLRIRITESWRLQS